MDLLNQLLETCATLTKKVGDLEQDKVAQAIEITKLKQRVRRLEKKRTLKAYGLKRLRKVRTAERVKSSADIVMDDQEDASKQGGIAELDADEDVTLEEDDEAKPTKLTEVIEVVTTAKLMTEVVTAAPIPTASAPRRRNGVVIRDPKEKNTPSVIVHSEPMSKDKGKGILVEEPKPLKRQAQIEQDEAYTRELEAELNANINWNEDKGKGILVEEPKPLKRQAQIEQDEAYTRELEAELNANINWNEVIEQVKRKEKQDNTVKRYQALKRKP
uniref:Uncharacterized protein n=1 Tax=Tanacetum cinerariifolium TaxID=118510 RepID=A0A699ITX0_TANCI|nr:hypothetical protein [Tanacetum cinerariifolium]